MLNKVNNNYSKLFTRLYLQAEIIRELNLGGAMIWSLDLDDFKNQCSCGRYPLITALSKEIKGERDHRMDCT